MGDREVFKLSDLCDFINGYAFKSSDYIPKSGSTLEVFRMGYISRGGGYKEDSTPVYIPENYRKNLKRFHLKKGDIAIAMTDMKNNVAILGNTAVIPDDDRFVLNQRVGCIRVKRSDKIDPAYLYYYSNWAPHVEYLRSRANSGVQVNLSTSAIKDAELEIPSLNEQRQVASVLKALDDKIELNRRMNETLEAMARAVFRDWFVDFGPTRAKMEGRAPYLSPTLWPLFPSHLTDQGTPEGWEERRLGDFFKLDRGLSYKGRFLVDDGRPMINLGCFLGDGKFSSEKVKGYSGDFKERHVVKPGTLLIANTDMTQKRIILGSPFIVRKLGDQEEFLFSHHVYAARPLGNFSQRWAKFFYFHLIAPNFRQIAEGYATGTTVLALPKDSIERMGFIVPDDDTYEAFLGLIEPLLKRHSDNESENITLAQTRDLLLPKLLSGEIRLPDAEKTAEAGL